VPLDKILVGENIKQGDVLIGVESNGIRSNGLSLARRAFFETNSYKLSHRFEELQSDLGTELLRPTHIYVKEALELLDRVKSVSARALYRRRLLEPRSRAGRGRLCH
jgi:phosphoribosylformylglycinamidine cyclo-ligase